MLNLELTDYEMQLLSRCVLKGLRGTNPITAHDTPEASDLLGKVLAKTHDVLRVNF